MKSGSLGIVETKYYQLPDELLLESGESLEDVTIAYESYGTLNEDRSNAILVCHALTGDAHAAGWYEGDKNPGWWDVIIGPGKALDTDRYFVICSNVLGGCKGSTGPASINPKTGKPYGPDFPIVSIEDIVKAQKKLVEHLGIRKLFAAIGGSMGGMQVLQWSVSYPDLVSKAVTLATTPQSSPQQIAFNEVGRIAITSDPKWNNGNYYSSKTPAEGLALARMIGHITYLSDESMHHKFGRKTYDKKEKDTVSDADFHVESYLHYKGQSFTQRFDANSYLRVTKAVDRFDLAKNGSLTEGFKGVKSKFLVISITTDWLYPPYQSKRLVKALTSNNVDVSYREIESSYGHDAFLLEGGQLNYILSNFLSQSTVSDVMKPEIATIKEGITIEEAARVMFDKGVTHLPVISTDGKLTGIVTSWDISKAVALKCKTLEGIMTREVVTADPDESIESTAKKMEKNNISALPVIEKDGTLIGVIGSDEINRIVGLFK
jgi:homoserine O-acetyltransferase